MFLNWNSLIASNFEAFKEFNVYSRAYSKYQIFKHLQSCHVQNAGGTRPVLRHESRLTAPSRHRTAWWTVVPFCRCPTSWLHKPRWRARRSRWWVLGSSCRGIFRIGMLVGMIMVGTFTVIKLDYLDDKVNRILGIFMFIKQPIVWNIIF